MSFKLADGSLNTDYKVGDEFVDQFGKSLLLINDDVINGVGKAYFKLKCIYGFSFYRAWIGLTPAKKEANTLKIEHTLKVGDLVRVKSLKGFGYFGAFEKGDYGRVKSIDGGRVELEGDRLEQRLLLRFLKSIKIKGIK